MSRDARAARRHRDGSMQSLQRIIAALPDYGTVTALTVGDANTKLQYIERHWNSIVENQHLVEEADLEQNQYDQMEDAMLTCIGRLRNHLHETGKADAAAAAVPAAAQTIIVQHKREPKIGQFDGRQENWACFADMFRVEVHQREDLDDLEKLVYLKAACVDTGKQALGCWPATAENYQLAWDSLNEKYSDTYATKANLIRSLFELPREKHESYKILSELHDFPRMVLQQLLALDEPVEEWGSIVLQLILWQAPINTVKAWERERDQQNEPDLTGSFEWLTKRARSFRATEEMRQKQDRGKENRAQNNGQPAANGRNAENNHRGNERQARNEGQTKDGDQNRRFVQQENRKRQCWICNEEHFIYDCQQLRGKPVTERKRMLMEKGICVQCGRRHEGECTAGKACHLCENQMHIDLICPRKTNTGKGSAAAANARKRPAEINGNANNGNAN